MVDESGRRYLDTRNNVCHVGHCNEKVARAVAQQVFTLNTNTRYLHVNMCDLARRLVQTMPKGSELERSGVCVFANSGTEANDLALRMARAFTKKKGVVVLDGAYHGHSVATMEISPYKYRKENKNPDYVEVALKPDAYRGRQSSKAYISDVKVKVDLLEKKGFGVSAFFFESFQSCAGLVVPPPTYLNAVVDLVHSRGGICICDEVQTALGRAVDNEDQWYAFETLLPKGQAPDIVTIGKPLGNGMPIACVITTKAIAEAFAEGPEYFNTFGGNPVCCAAALAVLEEIPRLRKNAIAVGNYLKEKLFSIAAKQHRHRPVVTIGDVRGSGLYLGVDLVTDFDSRQPATQAAAFICSALLREHSILTTLDGPFHNVIVIKPPLCFSLKDADYFLDALLSHMDNLATLPAHILLAAGDTPNT